MFNSPSWVPITMILAYVGVIILLALTAVFSETATRRDAAYRMVRSLLPWGIVGLGIQIILDYFGGGSAQR